MKLGDVIRARSVAAVYAIGNSGDVEVERKVAPIKGHRLVLLVLGVEGPGEKVDPEAVLKSMGWEYNDVTPAQAPAQEETQAPAQAGEGKL